MIGVIALVSRPQFMPAVLANYEQQTHQDKLLVVVENGAGIGACKAKAPWLHVTRSERNNALARNAGYAYLRKLGVKHWALFEDDDLYGPDYLAEHWQNRDKADVLGKAAHVLRGPDGSRWMMHGDKEHQAIKLGPCDFVQGGLAAATLFGCTSRALDWTPGMPWGAEVIWYTDMLRAGRTLYSTSSKHFTRCRHDATPGHAHATPGGWRDEVTGPHAVQI